MRCIGDAYGGVASKHAFVEMHDMHEIACICE